MTSLQARVSKIVVAFTIAVGAASPALAGPPLLCFPFDIGPATSLPWDSSPGWKGMRSDYDLSRLTGDTIALLTPATPVVVRMETLRRAALYGTKDTKAARGLLDTLLARAKATSGHADAGLAEFDAGYLIETYRQTAPFAPASAAVVKDLDGYAMVNRSLAVRPNDAAISFAAALMTFGGAPGHAEHMRLAKAGTHADTLLARNIDHVGQ